MSDADVVKCLRCQSAVEHLGTFPLMTGKSSAAAKFFLGQLAEMEEAYGTSTCSGALAVATSRCSTSVEAPS